MSDQNESPAPQRVFRFGTYSLFPQEHLLLRDQQPVSLTPILFRLLTTLVSNNGTPLSKEFLLKEVWPDPNVEEGNLAKGIFLLREMLGPGPEGEPWIQTVPRRGYRFAATVQVSAAGA